MEKKMKKLITLLFLGLLITPSAFAYYKNIKNDTPYKLAVTVLYEGGNRSTTTIDANTIGEVTWEGSDADEFLATSVPEGLFSAQSTDTNIIRGHKELKVCPDGTFKTNFYESC